MSLDPLGQKPDFEEYANEHAGTHSASTQIAVGIKQGCEHVWTSRVEPLMKELEAVRDHFDDTGEDYRMCLSVLKHCGELRIKAESRIRELEEENKVLGERVQTWSKLADEKSNEAQKHFEDRDKFAIGFARFISQTFRCEGQIYWKWTGSKNDPHTIHEAFALYKESLLNQKP